MKNTAKEFNELIQRYLDVKDELLEYTEEFHDSMFWDAMGYSESAKEDIDDINMKELKEQVLFFENLLSSLVSGVESEVIEGLQDLVVEYTYC